MGSSYTNLQLRTRDFDRVVSILHDGNILPAYVSSACERGWISVYPRSSESQDPQILRTLAMSLSKQLDTGVFGFLVHDSDLFWYVLCESGRQVDEYESDPGYFGGEDVSPSGGNMQAVARYCVPGTTIKDLTETFTKKPGRFTGSLKFVWHIMRKDLEKALSSTSIFRGDTLAASLGMRLGLPRDRVCLGYKYIKQGDADSNRFKLLQRQHEMKSREKVVGPPMLVTESQRRSRLVSGFSGGANVDLRSEAAEFELEIGEELNWYGTIRNEGAGSKGMRVRLEGEALSRSMFEIVRVSLEKWHSQTDEEDFEPPDPDDESFWPFIAQLAPTANPSIWTVDVEDFNYDDEILVRLPIVPVKTGDALLELKLSPLVPEANSSAEFTISLRVDAGNASAKSASTMTASFRVDNKKDKASAFGSMKISFPSDYSVAADDGKGLKAVPGVKYHLMAYKGQDTQFKLSIQTPIASESEPVIQALLKRVRREKRARRFTTGDTEQVVGENAQFEFAQWQSAKLSGFVAYGKIGDDCVIVHAETSDQVALREMRDVVFKMAD